MIERELKGVTEADLQKLIADPVREGKSIEYKSQLNLKTDDAKRKFLASIASFANSAGGDMVIGMKTDSVDKALPVALQPLDGFNPDADVLSLRDIIRRHIEPKVFTLDFQPVELSAGGHVLVIRIRKTWAGAHMVTYNDDFRFYTRDLAGRRPMDVPEIRAAFTLAEATVEKINRFRLERLASILAGQTPRPLEGSAVIVIHLCPLRSFEPGFQCDLSVLRESTLLPPLYAEGWSSSDDFDGFFTYAGATKDKTTGYSFMFRNGCFEATDTLMLDPRDGETFFPSVAYEQRIIEAVPKWFQALKKIGSEPPVLVMLSLLGVKGYWMYVGPSVGWHGARTINRDELIVPGALVESLDIETTGRTTKNNIFDLMRPMFDSIWNACGYPNSINFDPAGNWTARR